MKNTKLKIQNLLTLFGALFVFGNSIFAQEMPPAPSAARAVLIPAVREKNLPNGLTVAVVERKNVPLVTVQLLIRSGAEMEELEKAGLANMTAALLTKGTKLRTATQIAEQIEFLGGSINTEGGWNSSIVSVNVMADKVDQALAIMADTVLNPAFKQAEIDLLKSQTLDGLNYNLKQPGFLAGYVASRYSFNEHPAGGTPESIRAITRKDITDFHKGNFEPQNAVLIFTGDISLIKANLLARKYFGRWKNSAELLTAPEGVQMITESAESVQARRREEMQQPLVKRILIVDLPNAGQAAVAFAKHAESGGRIVWDDKANGGATSSGYFPALVLNSILGGGYSSRLNQEIRIRRGLSYGAGSSFAWRWYHANFATRTQTKNESAAEVAELVAAEINKLSDNAISSGELAPRKSVLTGNFGRNLETTGGFAAAVADLYSFKLPADELNKYTKNVQAVSDAQIRKFAGENLKGADLIIVGDYAKFKDDLAKRFPNINPSVIKAAELNLSKESLR